MRICILGSGNVATHFAKAIQKTDFNIVCVYSHHEQHAKALAVSVKCDVFTNQLAEIPLADIYLFSLKDSVLSDVTHRLYQTNQPSRQGLWVHTAGSMPLSVFPKGVSKGVIYPLMSLSKTRELKDKNIPLFVEADNEEKLQLLTKLALAISSNVTHIDSHQRQALHLAAVFANNFANHCYTMAFHLMEKANLDSKYLIPIIDETSRKIHQISPQQAQTGPAIRWDENVITKHLAQLLDNPELQSIYQLMSQSIHHYSQTSEF